MNQQKPLLALALGLAAIPAAAHGGHAHDLMAGLAHPMTGIDHLLAMLGVGIWSAQPRQSRAMLPLFLLMMAAGAMLPFGPAWLETGIAASVAIIGLALLAPQLLGALPALALVAGFALLHGQAHGNELPQAAASAGFMLSSAALLYLGSVLGRAPLGRHAGALLAASGLCLLAGVA